ncbi:MAG: excinuclease ABC subunit UvrA [Bryobacterales bacterium]|nr:excinuclease ABC subunit UvrA [Bryobacterales bacterium]
MVQNIVVHGARTHNLADVSVEIPRNKLTVITGLSGSGKSSLAFDTIYAEGQRRYVETLSPYARQFLDQMERPDVDSIDGLSPAISIEQKTTSRSPRSTVGTITEIYDYLRLLYSSIGVAHDPETGEQLRRYTVERVLEELLADFEGQKLLVLAPIVRGRKGIYRKEMGELAAAGYLKARIDGEILSIEEPVELERQKKHDIEAVVDKIQLRPGIEQRLEDSLRAALKLSQGTLQIAVVGGEERFYTVESRDTRSGGARANVSAGKLFAEIEPRSFSFNSPYGACETCNGLGVISVFDPEKVIADPTKPLLEGGLVAGANSALMNKRIGNAVLKLDLDISKPWNEYSAKLRYTVMYGGKGFAGIIPTLNEIYGDAYDDYQAWLSEFRTETVCTACNGNRLKPASLAVTVKGVSIAEFTNMSVKSALALARKWELSGREKLIAGRVLEEIRNRLEFLEAVGLDYLSLSRSAATISGGEAQRIRLATQIGSKLRGVLYVLDEPSIGLHPRDNERLLNTLAHLRDLGNTVIVVEHDQETIERADYVIDLGPGAGRLGGQVVAEGSPAAIEDASSSLTGAYLSGKRQIDVPVARRSGNGKALTIHGAREHNLKDITVRFPLGMLVLVTGVSGSGKSTLVNDILYRALAREVWGSKEQPGAHDKISGLEFIDKVIEIDQSPIGRTPRSNPATYTGAFTPIRELYAMLPESRERGYKPGRFSFNVKGGRCEACGGDGLKRIEMSFLPDVYVTCDVCKGRRYNQETLEVKYKNHSIADLLDATIEDALEILRNLPQIESKLQTLVDVGMGYVRLGQSSTTLSGGEAQRIKLARELSKRQTGKTVYILDEPTTGLHFEDVRRLLDVLQQLTDKGNTVLVIEHNLDMIKAADWVIDMGPEGGDAGGMVVAAGTPEALMDEPASHTGEALARHLGVGRAH